MTTKFSYDQVSSWSGDDVGDWIDKIGFPEANGYFIGNGVDGEELLHLDEQTLRKNIQIKDQKRLNKFIDYVKELQNMTPPLHPRSAQDEDNDEFDNSFEDEVYDNRLDEDVPNAGQPGARAPLPIPGNPFSPTGHPPPAQLPPRRTPVSAGKAPPLGQRQPPLPPSPPPVNGIYEDPAKEQGTPQGKARMPCLSPKTALPASNMPGQNRQVPPPPSQGGNAGLYEEASINIQSRGAPPHGRSPVPFPPPAGSGKSGRQPSPPPVEEVYEETDQVPPTSKSNGTRPNLPPPVGGRNRQTPPPLPLDSEPEDDILYEDMPPENQPLPKLTGAKVNLPPRVGGIGQPMRPPPASAEPEDEDFYEALDQDEQSTPKLAGAKSNLPPPPSEDIAEDDENYEFVDRDEQNPKIPNRSGFPPLPPAQPTTPKVVQGRSCPPARSVEPQGRSCPAAPSVEQQIKATGRSAAGRRVPSPVHSDEDEDVYEITDQEVPPTPPVPTDEDEDDQDYLVADAVISTPPPVPRIQHSQNQIQPTLPARAQVPPPNVRDESIYEVTEEPAVPQQRSPFTPNTNAPAPNRNQPILPQRGKPQLPVRDEFTHERSQPPEKPPSIPNVAIVGPAPVAQVTVRPGMKAIGLVLDKNLLNSVILRQVSQVPTQIKSAPKQEPDNTATGSKFGPVVKKKTPPAVIAPKTKTNENSSPLPKDTVVTNSHPPGGPKEAYVPPKDADKAPPGAPPTAVVSSNNTRIGPLPELPTAVKVAPKVSANNDISSYPWFFGNLERDEANEKVKTQGIDDIQKKKSGGTFLVRPSQKAGQPYTLCVFFNDEPLNIQVRKRQDGKFALGSQKPDENVFDSVPEMIKFHQNNAIEVTKSGGTHGKVKLIETIK